MTGVFKPMAVTCAVRKRWLMQFSKTSHCYFAQDFLLFQIVLKHHLIFICLFFFCQIKYFDWILLFILFHLCSLFSMPILAAVQELNCMIFAGFCSTCSCKCIRKPFTPPVAIWLKDLLYFIMYRLFVTTFSSRSKFFSFHFGG